MGELGVWVFWYFRKQRKTEYQTSHPTKHPNT
jgi:cbb3-type cytochrome oxidase subunit 3